MEDWKADWKTDCKEMVNPPTFPWSTSAKIWGELDVPWPTQDTKIPDWVIHNQNKIDNRIPEWVHKDIAQQKIRDFYEVSKNKNVGKDFHDSRSIQIRQRQRDRKRFLEEQPSILEIFQSKGHLGLLYNLMKNAEAVGCEAPPSQKSESN